jgi:catalase-peroxidase
MCPATNSSSILWIRVTHEQATNKTAGLFEECFPQSSKVKHIATLADLLFGSNAVLWAMASVYACSDVKEKFVEDFVVA